MDVLAVYGLMVVGAVICGVVPIVLSIVYIMLLAECSSPKWVTRFPDRGTRSPW